MRNRWRLFGFGLATSLSALIACVGDEPTTSATGSPDGSAGDATTGSDSGPGSDGAIGDGGGGDGGTFDPSQLGAKLAFWYRGTSVTSAVDAAAPLWPDDSTHANAATTSSPSGCIAPPILGDGPNNTRAVVFKPSVISVVCLSIPAAPQLEWGTGDFAVFVVARYQNRVDAGTNSNCGAPFFTSASSDAGFGMFGNLGVPGSHPAQDPGIEALIYPTMASMGPLTSPGNFNDNAWRIYGFRRRGSTIELYSGSSHVPVKQGSSNANLDNAAGSLAAKIGAGGFPLAWQLDGAIAEMIGVGDGTSTFVDSERDSTIDYLAKVYGL